MKPTVSISGRHQLANGRCSCGPTVQQSYWTIFRGVFRAICNQKMRAVEFHVATPASILLRRCPMLAQLVIQRRVSCAVLCGLVAAVAAWPQSRAIADPPDILRSYRFITDKSTVEVTGGIAGIDWPLNILGGFGLVTGYNYGFGGPTAHAPTLEPFAEFIDVNAILFDPRRASP